MYDFMEKGGGGGCSLFEWDMKQKMSWFYITKKNLKNVFHFEMVVAESMNSQIL